jgi:hypothetical protein
MALLLCFFFSPLGRRISAAFFFMFSHQHLCSFLLSSHFRASLELYGFFLANRHRYSSLTPEIGWNITRKDAVPTSQISLELTALNLRLEILGAANLTPFRE